VYSVSEGKIDQKGDKLNPKAVASNIGFVLLDPARRQHPSKSAQSKKRQ
jgi:hypothetical protein